MIKRMLLYALLVLGVCAPSHAADPFYTNLLNEGKAQLLAGRLDEALESFKIAEFGLIDEKEFVPELYYLYALARYRKGETGESQALLDKMKSILGEAEYGNGKMPREIEGELSVMLRSLEYMARSGGKAGNLPAIGQFYEAWDLLKANKLAEAEARIKRLEKMAGDENRFYFLEGMLAFQKGDYKRCLGRLGKIAGPLPAEFGEDASFYLAYSYLKRGDLAEGEKWTQKIKDPEYIHQIMMLMEEIKAGNKEKK